MFSTAHWWHDEMVAFALVLAQLSGLKSGGVLGARYSLDTRRCYENSASPAYLLGHVEDVHAEDM